MLGRVERRFGDRDDSASRQLTHPLGCGRRGRRGAVFFGGHFGRRRLGLAQVVDVSHLVGEGRIRDRSVGVADTDDLQIIGVVDDPGEAEGRLAVDDGTGDVTGHIDRARSRWGALLLGRDLSLGAAAEGGLTVGCGDLLPPEAGGVEGHTLGAVRLDGDDLGLAAVDRNRHVESQFTIASDERDRDHVAVCHRRTRQGREGAGAGLGGDRSRDRRHAARAGDRDHRGAVRVEADVGDLAGVRRDLDREHLHTIHGHVERVRGVAVVVEAELGLVDITLGDVIDRGTRVRCGRRALVFRRNGDFLRASLLTEIDLDRDGLAVVVGGGDAAGSRLTGIQIERNHGAVGEDEVAGNLDVAVACRDCARDDVAVGVGREAHARLDHRWGTVDSAVVRLATVHAATTIRPRQIEADGARIDLLQPSFDGAVGNATAREDGAEVDTLAGLLIDGDDVHVEMPLVGFGVLEPDVDVGRVAHADRFRGLLCLPRAGRACAHANGDSECRRDDCEGHCDTLAHIIHLILPVGDRWLK